MTVTQGPSIWLPGATMEPLLFGKGSPSLSGYRADSGKEPDIRAMSRLGRPGPGAPERDGEAHMARTGAHTREAGEGTPGLLTKQDGCFKRAAEPQCVKCRSQEGWWYWQRGCVCACVYACVCMCVHACMRVCACVCMCVFMCVRACMCGGDGG